MLLYTRIISRLDGLMKKVDVVRALAKAGYEMQLRNAGT